MNKKEDFTPGTIIFTKFEEIAAGWAVVFKETFWKKCAREEDSEMVEWYEEESETRVPVRIFGKVIGAKLIINTSKIEPSGTHEMHYTFVNINNQYTIIEPSISNVIETCWKCIQLGKKAYFTGVKLELEILQKYLSGSKYDDFSAFDQRFFKLFKGGIPIN